MLTPMTKVRIIGLKAAFPETLETLYTYGKIQFEDLRPQIEEGKLPIHTMELPPESEEDIEKMTGVLQRCRAMCQGINGDDACHAPEGTDNPALKLTNGELIEQATVLLDEMEPHIEELVARDEELKEQLAELEKYKPIVAKVEPVVHELTDYGSDDFDSLALLIDKKYEALFDTLEDTLREMSDDRTRVATVAPDDNITPAVVVFAKEYSKAIRGYLKEEQTNQIQLPEDVAESPLQDALAYMEEREVEIPKEIEENHAELLEYGCARIDQVARFKDAFEDRIEELKALTLFGETDYTFIIEGYVPSTEAESLKQTVDSVGSSVVLEERPIGPEDYAEVPVQVEKKEGMLDSFRAALGIWGTPQYGQFDPTSVLAISFPIVFGMIVGDAGYGLLMVILGFWLRKKFPKSIGIQNITGVLLPAGIMTIVFGIFYFEFFGDLAHVYIPGLNQIHPIHISDSFSLPFIRTESSMMTTLLFMAIGLGVVEVMVGLVLGMINGKMTGHTKHIWEKGGILLIFVAALMLVVSMMMPQVTEALGPTGAAIFQYASYLVLGAGFVFALFGGGIMGAVETLESVSHAASYIRIMAVGLVGALLADAANELAFVTLPNIGGVVIAIVLHVLNFAIILFSPSIHSLRLNFLEFFGKFFERGSKEYKPFARAGHIVPIEQANGSTNGSATAGPVNEPAVAGHATGTGKGGNS